MTVDLSKYPKGSKVVINAAGVETVHIPDDVKFEKKWKGASLPQKNWKKVQFVK